MKVSAVNEKIDSSAYSRLPIYFDFWLVVATVFGLVLSFFFHEKYATFWLIGLAVIGLLPVLLSAGKALIKKDLTIDLLASVALFFL